jgi:SufE protein probably involved in Fe-S center assembly
MTLENILADFQLLDDWEDRYRYVIELGRALPPLPEAARTEANKVRGCASQVWLATRSMAPPPGPRRASSSRATATPISCGG